jgi:hypothetical protein
MIGIQDDKCAPPLGPGQHARHNSIAFLQPAPLGHHLAQITLTVVVRVPLFPVDHLPGRPLSFPSKEGLLEGMTLELTGLARYTEVI